MSNVKSNVKFEYNDVSTVYSNIKSKANTIKGDLETMNSNYESVVQVPGGAIYGSLGAQLLLNWDNVSSSFPSFMNNFDNWGALIAQSHGNYSELEGRVTGFRERNPFGYSRGLAKQAMVASAVAAGTPTDITDEDVRKTLIDEGNPAIISASSPVRESEIGGYTRDALPTFRNLSPVEASTGAVQSDGSRSVVQGYVPSEAYGNTASGNQTEEVKNDAANLLGQTTLGPVPERKASVPPAETASEAPQGGSESGDDLVRTDTPVAPEEGDRTPPPGGNDSSAEGKGEITVQLTSGHGEGFKITDVTEEYRKNNNLNDPNAHIVLREYDDGYSENILVDGDHPGGILMTQ